MAKAKQANPVTMMDQGTRKARRLYVGNLPPGPPPSEQVLVDFFNAAVIQAGIALPGLAGPPVVSAWVSTESSDRKFAFVELRTMEECANALSLNGIQFLDTQLRISRPSDFDDAVRTMQAQGITIPLPGQVMPGMGGVPLLAPGVVAPMLPGLQVTTLPGLLAAAAAVGVVPTAALKLTNMVQSEDLKDPRDIEDITADVKEECSKYGTVLRVAIPGQGMPGAGNCYVRFAAAEQALTAQGIMNGRLFDGLAIAATFFDVVSLEAGYFH